MALALVIPPTGALATPSARAASVPAPPCAPLAEGAIASPSATWTLAPTGPKLAYQRAAFAPTTCQLIAFGGNDAFRFYNDTWLFDPASGAWTKIAGSTRTGPSARDFGELAWDATRKRVILFGGETLRNVPPGSNILRDTWAFDPVKRTWAPLITDCRKNLCPPARLGGRLVWSSAIGKLVLFGGSADGAGTVLLNDVWTFDGSWHPVSTTAGPSGRYLFGMAEDCRDRDAARVRGVTVTSNAQVGVRETWQLDPRTWQWTPIPTAASPDADFAVGMAWLPSLGAVVVTGGAANMGEIANSTWVFDRSGPNWVRVETSQPVPSVHFNATLTTDPCHGMAIFLGMPAGIRPPTETDYTWILR